MIPTNYIIMTYTPHLAYICMEFGIDPRIKTYSGGLGVLAGDTIKGYADMGIAAVGIGILYKNGYLSQELDSKQGQISHPQQWDHTKYMEKVGHTTLPLASENVEIDIWEYQYTSPVSNQTVSILYLDTDLPENSEDFRKVSYELYAADKDVFNRQLVVLGLGAHYALQALDLTEHISTFHLNESHSALLAMVLDQDSTQVVFTTHTPLKGGHTRLPIEFLHSMCTHNQCLQIPEQSLEEDGKVVNLTALALELADYSNAVSEKHKEVSEHMFPGHKIDYVTNGIHVPTWVSEPMRTVFNDFIPGWEQTPQILRYVETIPLEKIQAAHTQSRIALHSKIQESCGQDLLPDAFTIGFARRATEYKRATLVLSNPDQLLAMAHDHGGLNIVFAGKAYHEDPVGRDIIQRIMELDQKYSDPYLRIAYLPDYDMDLAKYLISGVDVWLNTPQVSYEASGTSGMKACLNGIPNISVDDGWWIEGGINGVNGYTIEGISEQAEIESMYQHILTAITLYHEHPQEWARMQRAAIALVGSYFNTHRMLMEYMSKGYSPSTLLED